ncbi:unnamed protein product, partial [Iphiclides podalirius]
MASLFSLVTSVYELTHVGAAKAVQRYCHHCHPDTPRTTTVPMVSLMALITKVRGERVNTQSMAAIYPVT